MVEIGFFVYTFFSSSERERVAGEDDGSSLGCFL